MELNQAGQFVGELLKLMLSRKSSDMFITADFPPSIKIDGKLTKMSPDRLSGEQTAALVRSIMSDRQAAEFEATKECNFAISPEGIGRFRVNAFVQQGKAGMVTKDEDFVTRLFVASTHTPILFFSSAGMVYKEKVWRLPQGDPRTKGRALINMLPLEAGETITSVMALPEDEHDWARLDVMFATRSGQVRRNKLSDFTQVNRAGKIAMKPDEGDGIVAVEICTEDDDILLTTANAQCIRFQVTDVRVFSGRTSTGVRGIDLKEDDRVIGMAVLRHVDVTPAEAREYQRRARAGEEAEVEVEGDDDGVESASGPMAFERQMELSAREQFILTITSDGIGKRASSYEYRVTGRGGKGLIAHRLSGKDARLTASFPVLDSEELLLVTDRGQLIRMPVDQIRIGGRATQGVILVRTAEDEHVVAAERLQDVGEDTGGAA
jgi:DNA gyrase subunit A